MDRESFYQALSEYIEASYKKQNPLTEVEFEKPESTTNLLDKGYVDSFGMVELILFIEQLLEIELPIENYTPDTFYTLESMYNTFVAPKNA